jgi:two-component system, OmpR family, response regulator
MIKDSKSYRVLLVEDDRNLGAITQEALELEGFRVTLAENGERGLEAFHKKPFDLCILDVMLPRMDGFGLAQKIRESNPLVPILFLTARGMKEDRIRGFKLGGDDYITKPFSMEELVLRIQAVMRRVDGAALPPVQGKVEIGKYTFNPEKNLLKLGGKERKLTYRESELLNLLNRHRNRILDRDQALTQIWENSTFFTGRSMDVYISRLRKYLQDDPKVQIVNIHGKGFKLTVE